MKQSSSSTSFFTAPPAPGLTSSPLPEGSVGKRLREVDAPRVSGHNGPVTLPFDVSEANGRAARVWDGLDEAWREAFRQGWDAARNGNIGVGACASTRDGEIIHAARNRINDQDGPHGEVFGSSLAHAEMNVLARLGFRQHRNLVLTTTL